MTEASVLSRRDMNDTTERSPVFRFFARYTPSQGWDSFLLILGAVAITGYSVIESEWVETPGLMVLILCSSFTGLILSKIRLPAPILHMIGLALGFAMVLWYATSLAGTTGFIDAASETWMRLNLWYVAATSGGISTDLLPFSITLLSASWLLGYVSTWFLFRSNNLWVGLVLSGVAILTNLSFMPDGYDTRFFAFIFLAMLLVARITHVQRLREWGTGKFRITNNGRWISVQASVVLCLLILLVTSLFPVNVLVWRTAVDAWNTARSPISNIEDEFARLFSPIASRKDVAGRYFGDTLPFKGTISLGGEVVMQARSKHPAYWLNRTYSQYTPQGWIAGDSQNLAVGIDQLPPPPQESFRRIEDTHSIVVQFETNNLWAGGNIEWISRGAIAETLKPKTFTIEIEDPLNDQGLPDDVKNVAQELRSLLIPLKTVFVEAEIVRNLPGDLSLISVSPGIQDTDRDRIDTVTISRKEPTIPDVVGWRTQNRLKEGDAYATRSYVSLATVEELRESSSNYSGYLKDHYLQLPAELPQRVRDLAKRATEGTTNPMDKALVIQDFLRSDVFEYSQDIDGPPPNSDGVDHFLFASRTGYSDYYASAMAVMMRTVGVPARLAGGYAPGEKQEHSEFRAVRDSDSHVWVQVYFPGHGWIDFEPTPAWPLQPRGEPLVPEVVEPSTSEQPDEGAGNPVEEDPCLGIVGEDVAFMQQDEDCIDDRDRDNRQNELSATAPGIEITWLLMAIIGIVAMMVFSIWATWVYAFSGSPSPEILYVKMCRLGTLTGLPMRSFQTPIEYGKIIGRYMPGIASSALAVATAFAAGRYGNRQPDAELVEELSQEWKTVRVALVGRALRRLIPVGVAGQAKT